MVNLDEDDIKTLLDSMEIDQEYIHSNYNIIPMKLINEFITNSTEEVKKTAENLFNECVKKLEEEKKEEDLKEKDVEPQPEPEPEVSSKKKKKAVRVNPPKLQVKKM